MQLAVGGRRVAAARTDDGRYALGLLGDVADLVERQLPDPGDDRVHLDGFGGELDDIVPPAAAAPLFADGTYLSGLVGLCRLTALRARATNGRATAQGRRRQ